MTVGSAPDRSHWWKPWRRDFWGIDVILGVLGLSLAITATILTFFLSSSYDAAIRAKADEAHALNAALSDNGRALFDVATTFATERVLEAHADAAADVAERRALTGAAMELASHAFTSYLGATAPEAIPGFEADVARLLTSYAEGDEAGPAKLRALTAALMDGPSSVNNAARGKRRPEVVEELADLRRDRDLFRAAGGFLQVFGLILAVSGQVAGRKLRTRQHAPPEIRALPGHPFTRRFWSIDVIGIAIGTAVSLTGTAVLFFRVDALQRDIDEARRQLEARETLVVVSQAAFTEYDDMAMLEPFVRDIEAGRTVASHAAPGVRADWQPEEDVTAIEIAPPDYVAVRKSYPVYWLMRMLHDNDRARFAADEARFNTLVQHPRSPTYLAMEADILSRAHARMGELAADRDRLGAGMGAAEQAQGRARDLGGLLLLLGLVITFAGNVTYYKRPRR